MVTCVSCALQGVEPAIGGLGRNFVNLPCTSLRWRPFGLILVALDSQQHDLCINGRAANDSEGSEASPGWTGHHSSLQQCLQLAFGQSRTNHFTAAHQLTLPNKQQRLQDSAPSQFSAHSAAPCMPWHRSKQCLNAELCFQCLLSCRFGSGVSTAAASRCSTHAVLADVDGGSVCCAVK
jgi:hypothetical protein